MATDTEAATPTRTEPAVVERNNRRTRWYHAGVYVLVLVLLATGWWLTAGREGQPSPLARLTGAADTTIHEYAGWGLLALGVLGAVLGWRAVATLLTDSVRFRRSDLGWFARWPLALLTGRFPRHEGHFDPGQRILNLAVLVLLVVLVGTGVGLTQVVGGPAFVWLNRLHKWATYAVTPVLLGHILVASGVLPGYRGAWRAMHLGGRLPARVARRLWPGWLDRHGPDEQRR
ncbi:MAG: cytochrome b/b6 domain-containing protein [Micromonosporaceae bacterium]|jgi:formate dehydrogenase subunit gamma|nr:cytochrome b/b6 domain-containing protein [Micromonosporaceae bacterium]